MDGSGPTARRAGSRKRARRLAAVAVACAAVMLPGVLVVVLDSGVAGAHGPTPALVRTAARGGYRATARAAAHHRRPVLRLARTMVGTVLVNHARHTVFIFTRDRHGRDVCAKIRHCLRDWPAVTTTRKPVAGRGVKRSLLGTIRLRGRRRQVTYAGHPLHTYRFDYGKASMMAIGNRQFGGSWFALRANGKIVR